jgi:hypothetical protein
MDRIAHRDTHTDPARHRPSLASGAENELHCACEFYTRAGNGSANPGRSAAGEITPDGDCDALTGLCLLPCGGV